MRRFLAPRGLVLLMLTVAGASIPARASLAATAPATLPSPTLLYPVNRVLQNPNPPVFHWTGVPGAVSYSLQVASDPTFATTVASGSTGNTRFTPTALFKNGTYYWRLRAQDSSNNLSLYVAASFSVNWRGAPQPSYPRPGQTLNWGRDTFVFSWRPQQYAATYNVQISQSPLFLTTPFTAVTPNLAVQVPGSTLRSGVTYYWRVQAVDAAGDTGYWTAPLPFVKNWHPTPKIQAPGGRIDPKRAEVVDPVLRWSRIDAAVKYQVQISTDVLPLGGSTYQTPPPDSIVDDETTSLPNLVPKLGGLANANYIWHVRGIDDQGNPGPWSYWKPGTPGPYRFTVSPPAAVRPTYPPNGATITVPVLKWRTVPYASSYEVQIAPDQNFNKANTNIFRTYTNELAPGLWTPAPQINILYYWRVRGVTGSGIVGKWSTDLTANATSFIFSTGGPVAAIAPVQNELVQTPVLQWTRLPNADHYDVSIHDGVTNAIVTTSTPNTTYSPSDVTLLGDCALRSCYWYVVGVLADGSREPTPDSDTRGEFTSAQLTSFPVYRQAVPTRPLPGDAASAEMPSFCWRAEAGAAKYQLFYSDSANTTNTYSVLSDIQTAALCQTPLSELPDGTYNWFVRGYDNTGGVLNDSPISQFTIQSGLLSPSGRHNNCTLLNSDYLTPQVGTISIYQPDFSWNPVPCAHGYHLYVAADPNFTNIIDEQPDYAYTDYLPKAPYYPSYAIVYVLVRPVLGKQADGTPIDLPPNLSGISNGVRVDLTAPKPVAVAPRDGARLLDTPLFQWNRYAQAASYELQVGIASDLTDNPVIDVTTFSTSFSPSADLADGTYYWRLRAINSSGQKQPWGTIHRFSKVSPAPALYGPANNSAQISVPVFTWQPVQRAAQYEIQVSNDDPTFQRTPLDDAKVNVSGYVPKAIYPPTSRYGYLYWRVRLLDTEGNQGPWSATGRFQLRFRYPILLTPGPKETLTTAYPVFAFQPLPGATSYQIEFSATSDFSTISTTISTPGTAWTPLTPQAPGTYYWRVRALDGSGGVGTPSAFRSFTEPVPPPATPIPAPSSTPAPTATPPVATPAPTSHVQITSAQTVGPDGKPLTSFPAAAKQIDYTFTFINASPKVDTFKIVVLDARTGTTVVTGKVSPLLAVSGTEVGYAYFYVKKTNVHVPFPAGSYRIEIDLDGKPDKNLPFTVK